MTNTDSPEAAPNPDQSPDQAPDQSIGAVISRLGPAAYLGIAWSFLPAVAGITLLIKMKSASETLLQFNDEGGSTLAIGISIYIGIFIVTAGIGVLPTMSQAILAGFAFGITLGFPAAMAGFTGASIIGYFIALLVARKRVESELHLHPKAEIVRDAFVRHGYWRALGILTLLRVSPASPFALMNGLMAVSGVRLPTYLIATVVGMAPRTFAYVWIGNQITNWDNVSQPLWLKISGIVLTLGVIILLVVIANKAIDKAMGTESEPDSDSDPAPPESSTND